MPIHPLRIVLRSLVVLMLLMTWVKPARPATALSGSDPLAIITAVNVLRATQGLPPYVIDQGLMSYALEHSRYQASLHTATHQHSDGTTVWQHGMDENIAVGMLGYLTPEYAVYTIWSDAIHMKTMIGYATGSVGAGVSDDGADEYYTLDVRPGGGGAAAPTGGKVDPNATPTKIIPIVPLLTVTPRTDRWMIHTVGYGQSLWAVAIAYGVKMDQIRAWNSMAADSKDIYAGQKLYIIAPAKIWPTLTASPVGIAHTGQTITPGRSITEEPGAVTQKAAYQTAAAQTQGPPASGEAQGSASGTAAPNQAGPTVTESPMSPGPATASPASAAAPADLAAPVDSAVEQGPAQRADQLPLVAGVLILVGGGLLAALAFTVIRREKR
jgi:LysM repeat protein